MFGRKRLYMDFASATPLHPRVARAMRRALLVYGNPSSPHREGREAKALLENARTEIARTLSIKSESLIFTGSGTESNNLALHGVIEALAQRGVRYENLHIVVSDFEHPSIKEPVRFLEKRGVSVSYVPPTHDGLITPEAVRARIRPETVLVSVAAVQGEIGTIQPIQDIALMLNQFRTARGQSAQLFAQEASFPILHSDASQSLFVNLSPNRIGADMASYDAQKIMGPKGIGALYKHSSVPLAPCMRGGSQERRLRAGTENVVGAAGMARAMEFAVESRNERIKRVISVRDYFVSLLAREIPQAAINGGMKQRIANNLNISIPGADGDYLAVLMDSEGVSVSPRSACIASGTASRSVAALGKTEAEAKGTVRFSFSPWVTKRDARRAVRALKKSIAVVGL